MQHNRVGADLRMVANSHRGHDLGAGTDIHMAAHFDSFHQRYLLE